MSSSVPYIGSKISLISNSEIRYEGILYTINTQESTIALQSVRCFGTEGRKMPEIPPSSEVYDFIIFRGQDIKDLTVLESNSAVNDPAIVSINQKPAGKGGAKGGSGGAGAAKGSSGGGGSVLRSGWSGGGGSAWGGAAGSSSYGGGGSGGGGGWSGWGNGGGSGGYSSGYGGGGYGSGYGGWGGSGASKGGKADSKGGKKGADSGKGGKADSKGGKKGSEPAKGGKGGVTFGKGGKDAGKSGGKSSGGDKGKGGDKGGGKKGGDKGSGKRGGGGRSGGAGLNGIPVGELQPEENAEVKSKVAEDFDIQEVNKKFDKVSSVEGVEGFEDRLKPLPGYDKSKSFFDSISCEATERPAESERPKIDREKAREFDKETFGDTRRPPRPAGGRPGKGRRRGGGSGKGYGR